MAGNLPIASVDPCLTKEVLGSHLGRDLVTHSKKPSRVVVEHGKTGYQALMTPM
jgi:hypothetical protein